jgi:tRNA nucleotidyltransferase/poly(A) polymerase
MEENFNQELKEIMQNLAMSGNAVGDRPLIVGGFVRDWLTGTSPDEIRDIDVISEQGKMEAIIHDFATRFGLGEPLEYDYTGTKTIFLSGYKVEFQSVENENVHFPIEQVLQDMGVEVNALNKNIYERDFTVNTLCYDVIGKEILDITGMGKDDLLNKKILRTPIPPQHAITFNPLIILRGFRFALEFGLTLDKEYEKLIPYGIELLPMAINKRSDKFVKKIVEDIFANNEDVADQLFRQYGLYDVVPIPETIMEEKVKSDMGLKYIALNDTLYDYKRLGENEVHLVLDSSDLFDFDVQKDIKKLASKMYLMGLIDEAAEFFVQDQKKSAFSLRNIKEVFALIENNKILALAQSGNFLYDRYRRRKEYRDRKRREEKRDRIGKIKMWHDFRTKFVG